MNSRNVHIATSTLCQYVTFSCFLSSLVNKMQCDTVGKLIMEIMFICFVTEALRSVLLISVDSNYNVIHWVVSLSSGMHLNTFQQFLKQKFAFYHLHLSKYYFWKSNLLLLCAVLPFPKSVHEVSKIALSYHFPVVIRQLRGVGSLCCSTPSNQFEALRLVTKAFSWWDILLSHHALQVLLSLWKYTENEVSFYRSVRFLKSISMGFI